MKIEEFKTKLEQEDDWAPGWDAIESEFEKLYSDQEPLHFGTDMVARVIFGGDQYLDGYSIYDSKNGYKHIVTFGMTQLYGNVDAFGGEWSKWGYEMTIKLKETDSIKCKWALDTLNNLARYTNTQEHFFEPFQFIAGNGKSICLDRDSKITGFMTIYDTEVKTADTIYGEVAFIQLVGITEHELDKLKADSENAKILYDLMKKDNPFLVTDLDRVESYL